MHNKLILSALVAITLTTANLAFAQGNRDRDDRGRNDQTQRGGNDDRRDYSDRRDYNDRRYHNDRRDYNDRRHHDDRREARGAGPNHSFYRGGRLPSEYRGRHYVVNDWRGHRLSAPPRGHHWVQTGGDYVLIAVASGVIVQLMLH
jgi:Ni/Co efflux regulator RcnB